MNKRQSQKSHAQSLIEFALILPLLLMFIMFIFDIGRAVYYYSVLYNAAREGARYGAIRENRKDTNINDMSGIVDAARTHVYGINPVDVIVTAVLLPEDFDADEDTPDTIETLNVRTKYCFTPVTPFVAQLLGSGCIWLQSESKMFIER